MRNYKCLSAQEVKTGNFTLLPIRDEDKYQIMKWRNEQIYHLRQSRTLTEQDQDNYFSKTVAALFEQEFPDQLLFSFLENNTLMGYGGLVHINGIDSHAEVSFIMDTELEKDRFEELWTVYLSLLDEIAFGQLKLHKLFTYAYDLRPHLYPVLENSGFKPEARLKDHCLFDGEFKDVVIHSKFGSSPAYYLRKVTEADTQLLFNWANDLSVRRNSISTGEILFETHLKWINNQLINPESHLFILTNGTDDTGQIRIQLKDGLWEIGYSIAEDHRGKKLGLLIVQLLLDKFPGFSFRAVVKKENVASIKVFQKLDFNVVSDDDTSIVTFVKQNKNEN